MRDHQHDYQHGDSDAMETLTPSRADAGPDDESPTMATDAGLDDTALDLSLGGQLAPELESDLIDLPAGVREIPISDLADEFPARFLAAPELADLNTPGEIDIEELDEDDADLPPDARLDPLEE